MPTGKLIIFSAPSGSGKTTIVKSLLTKDFKMEFSISATTRSPRGTEKHGVDYYFLSPDEFRAKIENNELLEWEEVYTDKYYGTLKSEVERITSEGNNVVFDVDVVGGLNIKKMYNNQAIAIFVKPPSIEELKNRLVSRGTDTEEVIEQRLNKAEEEMAYASGFDHIIVNTDLDTAIKETELLLNNFLMNSENNIGLYFGSFNPVHVGHLALANFIVENTELEEIWFIVSPQNPYKKTSELIEATHRINMLELSTKEYSKFKICDIELQLPTPSYTYATLRELSKKYPFHKFTIIMGGDNLPYLKRWKNAEEIMNNYLFMVYPRSGYKISKDDILDHMAIVKAPVFDIDSTNIRKGLRDKKNYSFLIPKEAYKYIKECHLYR